MVTGRPISARPDTGIPPLPGRIELAVLLYALSGGVLWWALHLSVLSALTPAVCGGFPHWSLTLVNVVCVVGVVTALYTSWLVIRWPAGGVALGRNRFLGYLAVVFNLANLALVVLESVPVYVLDACR